MYDRNQVSVSGAEADSLFKFLNDLLISFIFSHSCGNINFEKLEIKQRSTKITKKYLSANLVLVPFWLQINIFHNKKQTIAFNKIIARSKYFFFVIYALRMEKLSEKLVSGVQIAVTIHAPS